MGLNLSTQRSLELRLSVASTVAIGAIGYAALQKHRADTLRSALEDRSSAGGGKPAMPSKIRLIYFDIEGKGEAIRLALFSAGIQFEDVRVGRADGSFQAIKPTLMFGQLPCLQVGEGADAFELVQSAAILRYVARLAVSAPKPRDMYPTEPAVAALIDAIVDQEADAFMGLRVAKYSSRFGFYPEHVSEKILEEVFAAQNADIIPRHLEALDKILGKSSTGWLASTPEPSIADFFWVPSLNALSNQEKPFSGDASVLCQFPRLQALRDKFMSQEFVLNWIGHRLSIMNSK